MDFIVKLLSGVGVALPCGLNAFLPLLAISFAAKANALKLVAPFDFLASWTALIILAALVGIVLIVDKIPPLEKFANIIYAVVRPLAGGIAFAAVVPDDKIPTILGFIIGVGLAGAMHYVNTQLTPAMVASSSTLALFRPAFSFVQDFVAVVLTILALAAGIVGGILALLVLALLWWWTANLRRNRVASSAQVGR